jgi:hypothetical protein
MACLDVQPGGRLVKEHDPRLSGERQGHGESALLPSG